MARRLVIALAGNPNAGKTTVFNGLTGARQHVGNYPGITVEKKEGIASRGEREYHIVDLPGTYSLTAFTQEELVARNFVAEARPDAVVDVLNAGALERNLYLAVQLMEMGAPLVLALNMMDEARSHGLHIDGARLSRLLGLPVVETVARRGLGLDALLDAAGAQAEANQGQPWHPLVISYGPDLDPVLTDMTQRIEAAGLLTDRHPARWVALKYLECDEEVLRLGQENPELSAELEAMVETVSRHCQTTLQTYPEAIIADFRYGFIAALLKQGVLHRETPREDRIVLSDRLDTILTHRVLGPVLMFAILFAVYQITFSVGDVPMGWLATGFAWLAATAEAALPPGPLRSLLVSGVIDGVGGVMSFVPLILIIFLLIAVLEDSGYMARVAYMLDRVFRIFGLHGSSVMPFILSGGIGGGCAVPGVLASRTLRSPKEKLATLLTAPFMTCGAKLPVFILLAGVFFPRSQALVLFLLTLAAWVMALLVAKLLRLTVIRGPSTPFVMELPPYRFPTLKGMLIHTWERTWQYIKKAGTVILAISVLLWAAMTYPGPPNELRAELDHRQIALEKDLDVAQNAVRTDAHAAAAVADLEQQLRALETERATVRLRHSVAGRLGTALEPLSKAAGFDWQINIALIGGFAAKEVIISALATASSLGQSPETPDGTVEVGGPGGLAGATAGLAARIKADPEWTMRRAVSLMCFILLYAPCLVTISAIRQESGSTGWALFSMGFNTALAFALSVGIYQAWRLFL